MSNNEKSHACDPATDNSCWMAAAYTRLADTYVLEGPQASDIDVGLLLQASMRYDLPPPCDSLCWRRLGFGAIQNS